MKTVLILVFLLPAIAAMAQPNQATLPPAGGTKIYTLLLKDGAVVSGRIVRRDSSNLVVRQKNGQLTYVDLELFDRVLANTVDNPFQPLPAVGNTPVDDTNTLKNYLILFRDGTQVRGRIMKRDSTTLVIRLRNGEFTYADPALVEAVQELNQPNPGNPFAPFLTLNQTAYTVDPGHLYYRNVLLLYNEFTYGISRNWSLSASVIPFSLLSGSRSVQQSVNFSTKVSFPLGRLARIGATATYQPAGSRNYYKTSQLWNLQAVASLGDSQRSVTIGYGRSSQHDKQYRQPYFTLSALLKLSPAVSFITDNTLFTNQNPYYVGGVSSLFSAAVRFDRPRHAFDLGVVGATYAVTYFYSDNRNPQFFPYLAYNLRIGR